MHREHVFFDFANQRESSYNKETFKEPFVVLSEFANFAKNEGTKRFINNSYNHLYKSPDSSLLNSVINLNAQKDNIEKTILQETKDHSQWYLYELRKEFFSRWFEKSEYHSNMLNHDPLLLLAHGYLKDPEKINRILKP